jgi:hypothetical protein
VVVAAEVSEVVVLVL